MIEYPKILLTRFNAVRVRIQSPWRECLYLHTLTRKSCVTGPLSLLWPASVYCVLVVVEPGISGNTRTLRLWHFATWDRDTRLLILLTYFTTCPVKVCAIHTYYDIYILNTRTIVLSPLIYFLFATCPAKLWHIHTHNYIHLHAHKHAVRFYLSLWIWYTFFEHCSF